MKKYQIIYADPPWTFKTYSLKGKKYKSAECHYNCMSKRAIQDIPVNLLADDNCVLFLWVTFPCLLEGLELIKKWGFTYKTCAFTWVKKNKKSDSYFWGLGYWTRSNAELCLLATIGNPKRISCSVHQIIDAKIRKHSQKPIEVKDKIVKLMGDLPRIELFAREKTQGWDIIEGKDNADGTGNDIITWINRRYKNE
ncbi:MAG: MT-A70 family methyltransferase [Promethearchaeota archaeon]